jgi:hypothetical protein
MASATSGPGMTRQMALRKLFEPLTRMAAHIG